VSFSQAKIATKKWGKKGDGKFGKMGKSQKEYLMPWWKELVNMVFMLRAKPYFIIFKRKFLVT